MTTGFTSFSNFIHMGGYAVYVWPAFAITLIVLVINIIIPARSHRKLLKQNRAQHEHNS